MQAHYWELFLRKWFSNVLSGSTQFWKEHKHGTKENVCLYWLQGLNIVPGEGKNCGVFGSPLILST